MKAALLGLTLFVASLTPEVPRAPRHVALVIGISDYQNFAPDGPPGRSDLRGPANDIELIRSTLRSRLFENPEDILVLADSQASRAGIAAGFEWLLQRANDPQDIVVVYFSGHGSTAPDLNGDERRVTPGDSTDEGLVPWDARDIHRPGELVLDDQIGNALSQLRTRNVTVIVDACFSGTATRGETAGTPRGPFTPVDSAAMVTGSSGLRTGNRYTLITASRADQVALEKPLGPDGRVYGVLTYYLVEAMRGAGPTARYDELFQQLLGQVRGKSNQTPQLEGDRSALLLSDRGRVPSRPFVIAAASESGRFRIDEGAVHGVRRSAVYDLFPANATTFAGKSVAQMVIDSVGLHASTGRVIDSPPAAGNYKAVLARVPRGASIVETIPVFVHPDAAEARQLVSGEKGMLVTSDSLSPVRVLPGDEGYQVQVNGVTLPPLNTEEPGLCGRLARAFAILSLEQLRNPQPPPWLRIQARVLSVDSAPGNLPVAVDTIRVNQPVAVWVKVSAPSRATLYLSMVIMGYSSPTSMLRPEGYDSDGGKIQPIETNKWVRLVSEVRAEEPAGFEVLKILVDSDQYSLTQLVNGFGCQARRGDESQDEAPAPLTGWATVEHRVMILQPDSQESP